MPKYTLFDENTGEIQGIVEVTTTSALAAYTQGAVKSVSGEHNPALFMIDPATQAAVARPEDADTVKAERVSEVAVVKSKARQAYITTAHGQFSAASLQDVTAHLTAAIVNPAYTTTWTFENGDVLAMDLSKLMSVQRALVDHLTAVEVSAVTATTEIEAATTVAAAKSVTIPGGDFFSKFDGLDGFEIP